MPAAMALPCICADVAGRRRKEKRRVETTRLGFLQSVILGIDYGVVPIERKYLWTNEPP